MNFLDKTFGRLGNRMFQSAFLYAYAKNHGIDWYYQDPKWFEGYENEIKSIFMSDGGIGYDERVSIHIRRGKNPSNPSEPAYSENPFYVNLAETDYYQRAMSLFPNKKFLIFSDDIEWCKTKFPFADFSEGDEITDFKKMASCQHNIIANSTFSWWAAYLNPNPHKKIIYPLNWYSDGVKRTVCPKDWTGI